jgi:NarL family two-component system response regulator LiaR
LIGVRQERRSVARDPTSHHDLVEPDGQPHLRTADDCANTDFMTSGPIRVAVLSRYQLVRAGLAQMLGSDPSRTVVVNTAQHDGHLDQSVVVVYDLSGLETGQADLEHLVSTGIPLIGLTRQGRDHLTDGARALGVRAVVGEDVSVDELIGAVEAVAAHRTGDRTSGVALTAREREVLRMIGAGWSNHQIAAQLYVSGNTVKTYIRSAYRKIGVTRRPEAVLWAVRNGLVDPQDANSWRLHSPTQGAPV